MTYKSLLKQLQELGVLAPDFEAAEFVRFFDGKDRTWCFLNPDEKLSEKIDGALKLRESGMPLQYILGEAWFYGNRFCVSPECLIPQPDTEHLVSHALRYVKDSSHLLDLCTGSGCVAISILKENANITACATDISKKALDIATENSRIHNCLDRINLLNIDIFDIKTCALVQKADIIVSNPPYINSAVIPTLSAEVQKEPIIALDGGADGMDFYRHIILNLSKHMKPDAVMLLEIGYDQSDRIIEICHTADVCCRFYKDFGGNTRVAEIYHNHNSN